MCPTPRPSGLLAQERKLSRDLVHSNKKEQEFRSIFQHIQSAQSQRSPSELFAQHIVTIVHHVKGKSQSQSAQDPLPQLSFLYCKQKDEWLNKGALSGPLSY